MMEHLTVAENIFIGREFTRRNGIILDKREQIREPRSSSLGSKWTSIQQKK